MTTGSTHLLLPLRDDALRRAWRLGARNTFAVAAAFVLIVAGVMLATLLRERSDDLLTAPRIEQLKKQLGADSANEDLKALIRNEDQGVRVRWFRRRAFLVEGAWLLLGGAGVLAISAKFAAKLGASPFLPLGPAPVDHGLIPALKISLAAGMALTVAILAATRLPAFRGISFSSALAEQTAIEADSPALPTPVAVRPKIATPAPVVHKNEVNWLNFRGPGNLGVANGSYPLQWDASSGKNIAWHAPVPMPGHASPIVCGDRVFVVGGCQDMRAVYCFDVAKGTLRWTAKVGQDGAGGVTPSNDTGWAPATPACDGAHVFAIFPTGDLACLDLDGKPVWNKTFDVKKNTYGHASSLLAFDGMLFVQLDMGNEKDKLSSLLALDGATGKVAWKASRNVGGSWSSPALIPTAAGPQLITMAEPWIIAYDPASGAELWRAKGLSGEVVTSPAFAGGLLYIATDQGGLLTIRPDGHGDVSATHVKHSDPDTVPDVVSPLAINNRLLLISSGGSLCWFDATAAKNVWSQDIEAGFQASPIATAENRIYLTDKKGATHVIEAADAFKSLAVSPIGQDVRATPAFSAGRIFIRGEHDLFCIAAEAKP